jgi:hypothetical protein
MDGWLPIHHVALSETDGEGWRVLTEGSDAQLQNLAVVIDPRSVTYLVLQMRAKEGAGEGTNAQFFWRSDDEEFTEEHSVLFSVVSDDQDHTYLLRLASFPSWTWSNTITGLRLDPADMSGVEVTISSIEFIQVDELNLDFEQ